MFPGKHQQAQAHGHKQHVEDPCHVVNVQLTAHHLFLLITAYACEPDGLQLLCVTCEWAAQNTDLSPICITQVLFGDSEWVMKYPPTSHEMHLHGIMKFCQITSTPDTIV